MSTSSPKTVPTGASVAEFLATVDTEARRADCQTLVGMMQAATKEPPQMWGGTMVGFGTYPMAYANGSTQEWPVVAFSPRKNDLTLYLMPGLEEQADLLQRLGKHKTGKVCLYIKRLADVDLALLQTLIDKALAGMAPRRIFKQQGTNT